MAEEIKQSYAGTKIEAQPMPEKNIGVDTNNTLVTNIAEAAESSSLDISALESFLNVSQSREQIYKLIDSMSQDSTLSSVIESYAEDCVEPNDNGQIMWVEASDPKVAKYVSYLLDTINVDKYAYTWVYSLIKYGDLYLRLYKQSDYDIDPIFSKKPAKESKPLNEKVEKDDDYIPLSEEAKRINSLEESEEILNEDVNLVVHSQNDHYAHYMEAVTNPGEMFELTRFGKTMGYIKAPVSMQSQISGNTYYSSLMKYKVNRGDVTVYQADDFVHACLEDNSARTSEEVNIYLNKQDYDSEKNAYTYKVKRGQSLLNNTFKIWRELSLLENSVLLSRITKSSIVRMVQVEVGDMPKENIGAHLQSIKQLLEQRTALSAGQSMSEYTNPGPIENNIYIPTHGGIGAISAQTLGGDVDVKSLADLEYYRDKLFASLRVPKQYFGFTEDGAGFNGGESLSIISSRYGKAVKRIQNTFIQAITDAINLMLLDKKLGSFINKFTLRMTAPVTQEEIDKRENISNRVRVVSDIMNSLSEVKTPSIKLKILKSLITSVVNDEEVITLLQEEVDLLEKQEKPQSPPDESRTEEAEALPLPMDIGSGDFTQNEEPEEIEPEETEESEESFGEALELDEDNDNYLPSFSELEIDGTYNK